LKNTPRLAKIEDLSPYVSRRFPIKLVPKTIAKPLETSSLVESTLTAFLWRCSYRHSTRHRPPRWWIHSQMVGLDNFA